MPIVAYVFDAYGTLFDVQSAASRNAAAVGPQWERLAEVWRAKQLEYSWVESLMGRHPDFRELTERALDVAMSAVGVPGGEVRGALLDAYRTLDAYPEVPEVLEALKNRGARLAILSNGTPAMLADAVQAAGIGDLLDAVISVEEVGVFKPNRRVYELVQKHLGVPPAGVSFQSSNAWDAAGASAFGFRTVWVNRAGRPREYPGEAVTEVRDLSALVGMDI
ncbi:haloacid dehalogenase type II [Azospirillum sp.]|uniref:haloacid dehalogenase type II n=1 Tax=Azospirillum sp. TaxID=34012 RepID=UPI003D75D0CF